MIVISLLASSLCPNRPKQYFHQDDLKALIGKLVLAKADRNAGGKKLSLLPEAADMAGCSFRVLFRMLFTSRLATVVVDENNPCFATILVDADEVAALSHSLDQVNVSFQEAARALGVPSHTLAKLVAKGIVAFVTLKSPTTRRFQQVVSVNEIEAFECRYTTLYKYARATGRCVGQARDEIEARGIVPVTTVEEDGVTLYNKSDLPL